MAASWKRWTRTLHVYVSMLALVLVLLFGLTGFIMNHEDWFGLDEPHEETVTGEIPATLLSEPDRLGIVEHLRSTYGIRAPLNDFEVEEDLIDVSFKRPGKVVDVTIERPGGAAEIVIESGGILAALAAIHQGEDSGTVGSLFIDGTALFLVFISLTGLLLWTTLPARRKLGLIALAVSVALFGGVCLILLV